MRLCTEELFPVCSPRLLDGPHPLRRPADLARHVLLHQSGRSGWEKWLEAAGVDGIDISRGPVLSESSMAIDAAVDGHGVALARTALAAFDLLAGRLVRPFGPALPVSFAYWIVGPKSTADLPKIRAFRQWLIAEAADDLNKVKALGVRIA
jgi:LysR family glycine cleavage system transcriptional activator